MITGKVANPPSPFLVFTSRVCEVKPAGSVFTLRFSFVCVFVFVCEWVGACMRVCAQRACACPSLR